MWPLQHFIGHLCLFLDKLSYCTNYGDVRSNILNPSLKYGIRHLEILAFSKPLFYGHTSKCWDNVINVSDLTCSITCLFIKLSSWCHTWPWDACMGHALPCLF